MYVSRRGPPPPPGPPPPGLPPPPPPLPHESPWAGGSTPDTRDARSDRAADAATYAASEWHERGPATTTGATATYAVRGPGDLRDRTSPWLARAAEPDLARHRGTHAVIGGPHGTRWHPPTTSTWPRATDLDGPRRHPVAGGVQYARANAYAPGSPQAGYAGPIKDHVYRDIDQWHAHAHTAPHLPATPLGDHHPSHDAHRHYPAYPNHVPHEDDKTRAAAAAAHAMHRPPSGEHERRADMMVAHGAAAPMATWPTHSAGASGAPPRLDSACRVDGHHDPAGPERAYHGLHPPPPPPPPPPATTTTTTTTATTSTAAHIEFSTGPRPAAGPGPPLPPPPRRAIDTLEIARMRSGGPTTAYAARRAIDTLEIARMRARATHVASVAAPQHRTWVPELAFRDRPWYGPPRVPPPPSAHAPRSWYADDWAWGWQYVDHRATDEHGRAWMMAAAARRTSEAEHGRAAGWTTAGEGTRWTGVRARQEPWMTWYGGAAHGGAAADGAATAQQDPTGIHSARQVHGDPTRPYPAWFGVDEYPRPHAEGHVAGPAATAVREPPQVEHGDREGGPGAAPLVAEPPSAPRASPTAGERGPAHDNNKVDDADRALFAAVQNRRRRLNLSAETRAVLLAWVEAHRENPYPTKSDKLDLVAATGLPLAKLETWFINMRCVVSRHSVAWAWPWP
ncbi:Cinnamoyl-CoA reductase 1 [Allomyces arbusculus]|nr:Cinnamoyl-CoA reductase 1 [Allomyces arbusculus]